MSDFERSLLDLRKDRSHRGAFAVFARETDRVWRGYARYLARRWRLPLGVDEADVVQELLVAGWRAVLNWDPTRTTSIERYVRFQAIDKAKKWIHKQRDSYRRDGSAPSRAPTVFSAFERPDDEAGSAQDRLAWVGPEAAEAALVALDVRRGLENLARLPLPGYERDCLVALAAAGGSVDDAAEHIYTSDPALCLALRIGSGDDAVLAVRRTIGKAIRLHTEGTHDQ